MNGWPTCRRYPRSLSDAFADVRACAIERPRYPRRDLWLGVLLAIGVGVTLAVCLVVFVTPRA